MAAPLVQPNISSLCSEVFISFNPFVVSFRKRNNVSISQKPRSFQRMLVCQCRVKPKHQCSRFCPLKMSASPSRGYSANHKKYIHPYSQRPPSSSLNPSPPSLRRKRNGESAMTSSPQAISRAHPSPPRPVSPSRAPSGEAVGRAVTNLVVC